ncbi:hypothetical protein HRI_000127200 [Hibiscus trionum]|uniref:Uncharacterized protein n=1 Tax=Hibiscus trionum TaxID=183268 RepID=A0A9W7LHT3_HIBTR|nr:hypothetical protein HRI_000127200 [Hibiscus trionum]
MLEEIKSQGEVPVEVRNQRVVRYYNARVRSKEFQVGNLVLRNIEASKLLTEMGKMASAWEGPYKVHKVLNNDAYQLMDMDGKEVPRIWNARHLKKFFV